MKTSKRILNILFVAALILGLLPAGIGFAEGIPVVTHGYDDDATILAEVLLGNFSSTTSNSWPKVSLNVLGESTTYNNISWITPTNNNDKYPLHNNYFTLSYYMKDAKYFLKLEVRETPDVAKYSVEREIVNLGLLNYITLEVYDTGTTTVNLNGLKINGETPDPQNFLGTDKQPWSITGMDLSEGFSIDGVIFLEGKQPASHSNKVKIGVGHRDGPTIPSVWVEPSTVLLSTNATVKATVTTDSEIVMSDPKDPVIDLNIASADYSLNGGTWVSMIADDGFGHAFEIVSAEFIATMVNKNKACVQATDNLQTQGEEACTNFFVEYEIDGLLPPIDSTDVNVIKAGQTVPIKWRLTDGNGNPISNPDSFEGIPSSYQENCDGDLAEITTIDPTNASGLQYIGDGYWQWNWKTPKDLAGKCYALFVQFDSGQETEAVEFLFK